jgi:hypothetical protein
MPEDGPQADTTQSPSPLVAMLWTLMPGPGDHFDFVLMHANSEVPANDLLTTQSEADPIYMPLAVRAMTCDPHVKTSCAKGFWKLSSSMTSRSCH